MNYARISDQPFSTRRSVVMKKTMSAQTRSRREYIAAHRFSVSVDPSTKAATVKVIKNNER